MTQGAAMTDLQILLAINDIKRLKSRYFYYVDTKDWVNLEKIWTPDARMEAEGVNRLMSNVGAENIVSASKRNIGHMTTIHMGHMPDIEILTETTAKGRWMLEDILRAPEGQPNPQGLIFLHGFGHYHETYERGSDGWRIKTMRITRLHVDMERV